MNLNLDKSRWTRVTFGDVVRNVNDTVRDPVAAGIDRVIAMEHLDPGELKVERWGDMDDGTTFTRRAQPGQTLFGKRRAYQRKVAYAEFDAVCSGDIYTFEADPAHLLGHFLPFLVQSDGFFNHALGTSAGSLSPRTNWRDLANFEFDLPPLDEQRRLAELLWAVEQHRRSLESQAAETRSALRLFLLKRFREVDGQPCAIVDLCSAVVGGVWGAPEGEAEVDVLALGPRVYAGDAKWLSTDGSPVRSVTRPQAETRMIQPSDIILERSGGSADQPVGRVVIAGEGLPACVPTDFQRLLRPDQEKVEPQYLFWKLRLDWLDGVTRDYSKRTTNISNLAVPNYLSRRMLIPSRVQQERLVADVQKFERALAEGESSAAYALRSSLLDEIFGGN